MQYTLDGSLKYQIFKKYNVTSISSLKSSMFKRTVHNGCIIGT